MDMGRREDQQSKEDEGILRGKCLALFNEILHPFSCQINIKIPPPYHHV